MLALMLWRWVLAELARGECRPLEVCACAVEAAGLPEAVAPVSMAWCVREYPRARAEARVLLAL